MCAHYLCADVCYEQGICVYMCLHVCNLEMCEEFGEKGLKICEKTERGAGTQLETDWLPAWGGNKNLLSSPVWDLGDQAQDVCHGPWGPRGVPSTLLCLWKRLSHFIIDSLFLYFPRSRSLSLSPSRAHRRESGERLQCGWIRVTQNQYCAFRRDRYIRDGNSLKCSFVTLRGFERGDGGVGILKNHDSFFNFPMQTVSIFIVVHRAEDLGQSQWFHSDKWL